MSAKHGNESPAWHQAMVLAWQTLESGKSEQASVMFSKLASLHPHVDAFHGHARALMDMGRLVEAEDLVEQMLDEHDRVEEEALLAEILGRSGMREEAQLTMTSVLAERPDIGFYHALMAEQLVYLGMWSKGASSIIEGFRRPGSMPDCLWHLQWLVTGLSEAIARGSVAEGDAMQLLQRLNAEATSGAGPLAAYVASARRALHNKQPPPPAPMSPLGPVGRLYWPGTTSAGAPRVAASGHARQHVNPHQASGRQPSQAPPLRRPPAHVAPAPSARRRRNEVAEAIGRERALNEELQSSVTAVEVPAWPSQQKEAIDTLAPVWQPTGRGVLRSSAMREQPPLAVTRGDILVEIALDRCMQRLMSAFERNTSHPLVPTAHAITQLELNLLEGIPLSHDERYLDISEDFVGLDVAVLGMGRVLGRCLEHTYGGNWSYVTPPEKSVLQIGKKVVSPMEFAKRWLTTPDKDDVWLEELDHLAHEASDSLGLLAGAVQRPDPTADLRGGALVTRLAELWCAYRLALQESQFPEVAHELTVVDDQPHVILFSLPARWLANGSDERPQEWMAYERSSGQFLRLSLRKHLARYMAVRFDAISTDTGAAILALIGQTLPPPSRLVDSEALAREIREKLHHPKVKRPTLQMEAGRGEVLECWIHNGEGFAQWRLSHDRQRTPSWSCAPNGVVD